VSPSLFIFVYQQKIKAENISNGSLILAIAAFTCCLCTKSNIFPFSCLQVKSIHVDMVFQTIFLEVMEKVRVHKIRTNTYHKEL